MTPTARGWIYLFLTVMLEVVATLALRASDGFTQLVPSLIAIVSYAATVVVLSWALQTIPMSVAYVVWTALGTAGIVLLSIILFGDTLTPPAWAGIVLVVLGVSLINAFPAHQPRRKAARRGTAKAHSERP